jgi:anti-sigma factor RsiW
MDCAVARAHLLDAQAGRLAPDVEADLRAHVGACAACAHEDAAERALTDALERRLPLHPAPLALKRRLAARWPAPPAAARRRRPRWAPWLAPAAAVAVLLVLAVPLYRARRDTGLAAVTGEAVEDHLRVLDPDRPLGVTSGGIHQVKPWFAGRLDFAPVVRFEGDAEFPLRGGAVDYVLGRRAAVLVYARRLHTVSLIVFRPEGVPLPPRGTAGRTLRGFHVLLWRDGDLGYALVSDLDPAELRELAGRLAPPG